MKITQAQAKEALARIDQDGSAVYAQHQCYLEQKAIEPYTSRDLEAIRQILIRVAAKPRLLAALYLAADGQPFERYTVDGEVRYRAVPAFGASL